MGSCVSRSPAAPSAVATGTAKVVCSEGSMAQFAGPVTAHEALGDDESRFLCSSDELRFDVPARALAAEEALQPGWLYFVLPLSMLRRPISGQEMAALAVKASSALSSVGNGKGWKAARVAPLVVETVRGGGEETAGNTKKGAYPGSSCRREKVRRHFGGRSLQPVG